MSEPGGKLNPRFESETFEKFVGPPSEFVDPAAEYLLFSDVVNDVNVRLAKINKIINQHFRYIFQCIIMHQNAQKTHTIIVG